LAGSLYKHAPVDYRCPFCLLLQGDETGQSELKRSDIVFQDADVTAFIAIRKYPNNQGHVLIIPNEHFENIYDLPLTLASKIHVLSRDVALAMKSEYRCDGILLRQHNEPAGDQNIWHYHLHVIPRYEHDDFHSSQKFSFEADARAEFAQRLRNWFSRPNEKNV
jgi:histidine triad (HIT) family protein